MNEEEKKNVTEEENLSRDVKEADDDYRNQPTDIDEWDFEDEVGDDESDLVDEVLNECQGTDEDGYSKSSFVASLQIYDEASDTATLESEFSAAKPILTRNERDAFVELVYTFENPSDPDMYALDKLLKEYDKKLKELSENVDKRPFFVLVVVPLSALGAMAVRYVNPVFWSVTAERPGAQTTQIKLLFFIEDEEVHQTDVDLDETAEEVAREIDEEAQYYDELYEQELDKQINKLEQESHMPKRIR